MDTSKGSLPSSSSKSELFIITPDELQKLGILKATSLICNNSETECISKNEKNIDIPEESINLNPHICKSNNKKDSRKTSGKVSSKPEILNSKICSSIQSNVDVSCIKTLSLESLLDGQLDKKIISGNLKPKLIESTASLTKYEKVKVEGEDKNCRDIIPQPCEIESFKQDLLKEILINKKCLTITDNAISENKVSVGVNSEAKRPRLVDESPDVMFINKPISKDTSNLLQNEITCSSNESTEENLGTALAASKNDILEKKILENDYQIKSLENPITEKSIDTVSSECVKNVAKEKLQLPNKLTAVKVTDNDKLTITDVTERLDDLTPPVVVQSRGELKTSPLITSCINPEVMCLSTSIHNTNEIIGKVSDAVEEEQTDRDAGESQSSKGHGEMTQTPLIKDEICSFKERDTLKIEQIEYNDSTYQLDSYTFENYEYQDAKAMNMNRKKIEVDNDSTIVGILETPGISVLQTPKKRGRKKKSDIFASNITLQDIHKEPEIKIPRKRGRPRKYSETDSDQTHKNTPKKECNIYETPQILEESKTGRKRIKVDYFAMENNLYELEIRNLKTKRNKTPSFSSDDEEIQGIEQKFNQAKKTDQPIAKNLKVDVFQSTSSDDDEPLIKKSNTSKDNVAVEECEESNGAISSSNAADQTPKPKYNRTGETSKMMKSIFSAAFKITPTTKTEDAAEKMVIPFIEPTHKRGRPKKDEEPSVIVDNKGNIKCAVCEEKMANVNWKEHNMREHYNLSWREGEPPLILDEDIFLRKTLKPVLLKYRQLQCKKCNRCTNVLNDFIEHRDVCLGLVVGGMVTCAVCNLQMDKKKWLLHKLKKHNNLAWRVGDKPLNLNNQSYVLSVLNALYKAKKPLFCNKCETTKKSVVGFLSHQAQCGITEAEAKVKCEFCDKLVLPVSMPTHIKMIHETPQKVISTLSIDDASIQPGLRKRKAALDAMVVIDAFTRDKIQQEHKMFYIDNLDFQGKGDFIRECLEQELETNKTIKCKFRDCQYQSEDQELFLEHMNNCGSKPNQYYACLRCLMVTLTEKDIRDHVRSAHKLEVDVNFDYIHSGYEEEQLMHKAIMKRRRQDMMRLERDGNCKVKPAFLCTVFKKNRSLFSSAFEYTLEFCNEHYTQSTIFNKLNYSLCEWQPLEHDQLETYLPKVEISCEVSRYAVKNIDKIVTSDQSFKRYELFESQQDDGHTTIYCGGPILALAWLPTPHMYLQCKQVLAVAAGNSFDAKYTVNSNYAEATVIQFWYFDILKNKTKCAVPLLMFCLAVDIGPVWHLEWCPSGCYNESEATNDNKLARMGLLAVAGSDSTVHIYAVPFLNQNQMGIVYKPKPLLKLRLLEDEKYGKRKYFPTRISWSKASGHRYLSVGYTNGMVAIFDLETTSRLLRFKDESGVDVLLPYNSIDAHKHYISVLSMIHLKGGTNWLLTGSFDRDICLWDLRNNTCFITHRRKIVSDGAWFTNWVSHIHTMEESATNNRLINATVSSHRHYMYEPVSVISSASSITSVSTSDWLNGVIQGSSVGDISSSFPHQILYNLDYDKTIRYLRYFFGCTRLVPRLDISENGSKADGCSKKALTYDTTIKQYGLVFCDMKMDNYADFSPKLQERFTGNYDILKTSHLDMYPIQAINKIAFNPNCQASLYYAAGYQAGFVRLTYLKFLENDRQVV